MGVLSSYISYSQFIHNHRNDLSSSGFDTASLTVFLCTVAFAAMLSVGVLLAIHVYLSLTNQTTLELYINYDEGCEQRKLGNVYHNPFDQGWRKNLRRVLGDVPWYRALLLPSLHGPPPPLYPFSVAQYLDDFNGV